MSRQDPDDTGSLLAKTRALLNADDRSLAALSQELGVNFYWLRKLASGDIENPSVNRVQYVYERLTGRALTL